MMDFIVVEFETGRTQWDLININAWRAVAAEFLATFIFVFVGCGSVIVSGFLENTLLPDKIVQIALAHGLTIAIMVGTIGSISGGHINPVITLGFVIAGRLSIYRGLMYFVGQMSGAILGAGILYSIVVDAPHGTLGAHSLGTSIGSGQAVVCEIILTFILVMTVFGTAVDPMGPGNIAPLLIGFAIIADHLVGVPLTGASMNPARSFGPAVWSSYWTNHWVYWVGPIIGSVAAVLTYTHILLRGMRSLGPPLEEEITAAGQQDERNKQMGKGGNGEIAPGDNLENV